ncbi:hypothetical protein BJV82DRAFT_325843 [Fennellomyces sp. T-0311]|nr:hypothetical protein BJV82DRAFT_325843 [Fennellomyces sp. T-0311]
MKLLSGSKVNEPYCALSYSWNQSGDYFKDKDSDEYIRDDRGQHQIISYQEETFKRHFFAKQETRVVAKVRHVKYEELVEQICHDFGVGYLWWDQKCIDQSNPEEKKREIKQMHTIYKNAYCTLILVPELDYTGRNVGYARHANAEKYGNRNGPSEYGLWRKLICLQDYFFLDSTHICGVRILHIMNFTATQGMILGTLSMLLPSSRQPHRFEVGMRVWL